MKPKYAEVYEKLLEEISQLQPGDKIDSEVVLSKKMDVAPMTVRRALALLTQEGRTIGIPGKGTFVSDSRLPSPTQADASPTGLTEQLLASHLRSENTAQTTRIVSTHEAALFKISPTSRVYVFTSEKYSRDTLVATETSIVNGTLFPDLLSEDTSSLELCFEENYGRPIVSSQVSLQFAPSQESEALGLPAGSICPEVRALKRDSRGNLALIQIVTFLPEAFTLHMEFENQ